MNGREITLPAVLAVLALVFVGVIAGYASAGSSEQAPPSALPTPAPVGKETRPSAVTLPAVSVPQSMRPRVKPRPKPTFTTTTPTPTVPEPQQPAPPSGGDQFDSVG